jgi:2-(1,2-epoxy-1,2-dihydrophenyl)acetyl-CoA isomerase
VPADSFASEVTALAQRLAAGPTLAYASIRASLAYAETHPLDDALAFEGQMMARTGASADHRRAVESFLAGEKPSFAGR